MRINAWVNVYMCMNMNAYICILTYASVYMY